MTVHLVGGHTVTVLESGTIEYRRADGSTFRRPNYERQTYAERVAFVRRETWGRGDVRFITSK